MRALPKACMELLEDATWACAVTYCDPEQWPKDTIDDASGEECIERGLVIYLPCVACAEAGFDEEEAAHYHLTVRGVSALHFYRDHKELLK